jgi:hypothetical protein
LLAALHPNADDTAALETQVYQAILERRPAQAVSRLKEILAKPDPALGFYNGELRFWLAGRRKLLAIIPPPWKVGDRRGANWNLSSKTSRKIITSRGWRRAWESLTAPSPLYRNYSRYRTLASLGA